MGRGQMLATFGRYLQCLSGTLSSTFLRDHSGEGPASRANSPAVESIGDSPEAARDILIVPVVVAVESRHTVRLLRDGRVRGQRDGETRGSIGNGTARSNCESHRFLPLRILSGLQVHSGNTGNRRGAPVSVRHDVRGHIKDIGCVCAVSGHRGSSRTCGARRGCGISTKIHHPGENARAPQENRGGEQADWLICQPRR